MWLKFFKKKLHLGNCRDHFKKNPLVHGSHMNKNIKYSMVHDKVQGVLVEGLHQEEVT